LYKAASLLLRRRGHPRAKPAYFIIIEFINCLLLDLFHPVMNVYTNKQVLGAGKSSLREDLVGFLLKLVVVSIS